jgi:hypothetical protein
MKSNTNYWDKLRYKLENVKPEKEKEKFLTKEQRKNLISDILNSQERLTYYNNNREVFPDRDYRNLRMDREEDNIYKIQKILINNKF